MFSNWFDLYRRNESIHSRRQEEKSMPNIPWTLEVKSSDIIIQTKWLKIEAPIDTVWECVTKIHLYEKYSGGLYKAALIDKDSELTPGKDFESKKNKEIEFKKDKVIESKQGEPAESMHEKALISELVKDLEFKQDKMPSVGQTIKLELENIPSATETIICVESGKKIIGWSGSFGYLGQTERLQYLVPSADGKATFSIIADRLPRAIGYLTKIFVDRNHQIEKCFDALNCGIGAAAEELELDKVKKSGLRV